MYKSIALSAMISASLCQAATVSVDYTFSRFGYDTAVYDLEAGYISGTAYGGGGYTSFIMPSNQSNPGNPSISNAPRTWIQTSNSGTDYAVGGTRGFYIKSGSVETFVNTPYSRCDVYGISQKYVVGSVLDEIINNQGYHSYRGMVYDRINNSFSYLDCPGNINVTVTGIHGNRIVGYTWDGGSINYTATYRGFWSELGSGIYNYISIPNGYQIIPNDISENTIVGTYIYSSGNNNITTSFIYDTVSQELSEYSYLGQATQITGIDGNKIAGSYYDNNNNGRRSGFLATIGSVLNRDWEYTVSNNKATITSYIGTGGAVTIPSEIDGSPVVKIGASAFINCISLTTLTIPNSVFSIEDSAFSGCVGLTSVSIGNSVTSIGKHAFYGCSSLTSVTIPESVTNIGGWAFHKCTNLRSIMIPNSVTSIGNGAFSFCSSLTSITIPNGITSIGEWFFAYCSNLKSIIIPSSMMSISENNTFTGCPDTLNVFLPRQFRNNFTSFGLSRSQVTIALSPSELDVILSNSENVGLAKVTSNPNTYNLYTTSQIQNMAMGDLVLTKQVNGKFVLNYDIEQSEDLKTWTTYRALYLPLNGLPTDKAFVRIKAKQEDNSNPGSVTPGSSGTSSNPVNGGGAADGGLTGSGGSVGGD